MSLEVTVYPNLKIKFIFLCCVTTDTYGRSLLYTCSIQRSSLKCGDHCQNKFIKLSKQHI